MADRNPHRLPPRLMQPTNRFERLRAAALACWSRLSWRRLPANSAAKRRTTASSISCLGNGMEVVVIPDRRAPVVTHMVWYKVGSADEPPGKSGIAHFFEHLMFKGTKTHAPGEFGAKVAEIGGSENAFTSYDYTAYYQTVAPEALGTMMAYESDRMRNLILTDQVIGPERDVILEERRSRIENSPDALLDEEVDATLYQNHPYRIPVIGWMHEMEKLNRTDATAFYDRYYRAQQRGPDRRRRRRRRARCASWPRRPTARSSVARRSVRACGRRSRSRIRGAPSRLPIRGSACRASRRPGWCRPTRHRQGTARPRRSTCSRRSSAAALRSRIYQKLVVEDRRRLLGRRLLFRARRSMTRASRSTACRAATRRSMRSRRRWTPEIARIVRDGVTETELEKAKTRFLRSMIFARDNQAGMANMYGATLATGGTVADIAEWPERIRAVTPAQVQAVAAKYLDPTAR